MRFMVLIQWAIWTMTLTMQILLPKPLEIKGLPVRSTDGTHFKSRYPYIKPFPSDWDTPKSQISFDQINISQLQSSADCRTKSCLLEWAHSVASGRQDPTISHLYERGPSSGRHFSEKGSDPLESNFGGKEQRSHVFNNCTKSLTILIKAIR